MRSVAERYLDAVGRGNIDGALSLLTPDADFLAPPGSLPVPHGVRSYLQAFEDSFPGGRFEVSNTIEAGDQVVLEGTWIGQHTGVLRLPDGQDLPPTNREVHAPFAIIFRVREGKIVACHSYWDLGGFMAQLTS